MQRRLYALFSAMFLSFLNFNVNATPITFDFTSSSESYSSQLTYSFGTLDLNVWSTAEGLSAAILHQDSDGLGVFFAGDNSKQLENSGPDESLIFSFNQTVRLLAAGFGLVGSSDDYLLNIDNTDQVIGNISSSATSSVGNYAYLGYEQQWLTGNLFLFQPLAGTDYFKIADITIASVPEPSTSMLLLLGMSLFMLVRYIILIYQLTD